MEIFERIELPILRAVLLNGSGNEPDLDLKWSLLNDKKGGRIMAPAFRSVFRRFLRKLCIVCEACKNAWLCVRSGPSRSIEELCRVNDPICKSEDHVKS